MRQSLKTVLCLLFCIPFFNFYGCQFFKQTPPQENCTLSSESNSTLKLDYPSDNLPTNNAPLPAQRKLIALTFDDAPFKTLENILAVFASYNEQNPDCPAAATIFFNRRKLTNAQLPLLQMAYTMGFELGNHTATHANLSMLTLDQIKQEIDSVDEILSRIDGQPHHLFRAPFGIVTDSVKQAVHTPIIDWTIDTKDWTGVSADEIVSCVLSQKFNGAIALLHDGYPPTVSALKILLPTLKQSGYQVVTVSQMAKLHGVQMQKGSVYIRLRPTQ